MSSKAKQVAARVDILSEYITSIKDQHEAFANSMGQKVITNEIVMIALVEMLASGINVSIAEGGGYVLKLDIEAFKEKQEALATAIYGKKDGSKDDADAPSEIPKTGPTWSEEEERADTC